MSSRTKILDGALALLRSGGTVSLESAAQQAELTKPGLMHHFGTKQALMLALVDHVVDGWERELSSRLPRPPAEVSARDRIYAYVGWLTTGRTDPADLVMLADPRLRDRLSARWAERLTPWLELPAELPPDVRARLASARMLADGVWLADSTGVLPLADDERERVRAVALELLDSAGNQAAQRKPARTARR